MVINQIKIKRATLVKKTKKSSPKKIKSKATVKSFKNPIIKQTLTLTRVNQKNQTDNSVVDEKTIQPTTKPVITNSSLNVKTLRQAVLNELARAKAPITVKSISKKSTVVKKLAKKTLSETSAKNTKIASQTYSAKTISAIKPKIDEASEVTEELLIEDDSPDAMVLTVHKPFKKTIELAVKWAVGGVIFLFLLITANLYFGDISSIFNRQITKFIPYPGFIINHKIVLLKDFQNDLVAVEKNIKRQDLPYTATDVKNNAFKTLVQREVIFNLAKQQNLIANDTEINQQLDPFIEAQGGEEKTESLVKDLYGWNIRILKEKIIKVLLLTQKLSANLKNINGDVQKRDQLKQLKEILNAEPAKFSELAEQLNEDSSKFTNGDLGWFKLGETVPEFEIAVLNLEPGEISDVIETAYGYHLIKLEEEKTENQEMTFHVSQIFLNKVSFLNYLDQETKKAKITSLIKLN